MNWRKDFRNFLIMVAVVVPLYIFVIEPVFHPSRDDIRLFRLVFIGVVGVIFLIDRWRKEARGPGYRRGVDGGASDRSRRVGR